MPDVQITSFDGQSFTGYLAAPTGGNGPGLLLIHEIFGLDQSMRDLCDRFASHGFIALCPDLFWRQSLSPSAVSFSESDWEQAAIFYKNFDVEAGVRDLLAALAHLRQTPGCGGKVGVVGSCLGGRLAFLMAARSDIDCGVCYYGVGLESLLDEVHDIRSPFLLHIAEQDKLLPPPVQKRVIRSLARNPLIAVHTYPAADHGFARKGGVKYAPDLAALADQRTFDILEKTLLD